MPGGGISPDGKRRISARPAFLWTNEHALLTIQANFGNCFFAQRCIPQRGAHYVRNWAQQVMK
ncbi:hypothetical protein [Sphingobium sp. BS19]|uniref:hypothetical protein n=1 Tax=Sphingobium sp. BS19 TaxID=3018973 RepID=UPI0022EE3B43|nr:hypothetical protein [Sphingobium sp. BS19]GLJ00314.1 hypothetical protein Sbs19_41310 [Sphingobium sp. BS19]